MLRVLILQMFFLIFNSISYTAPVENNDNASNNNNNSFNDDYEYDDDDYDDADKNPEIAANRQLDITSSTTTTTYRPIFSKFYKWTILISL